MAKGRRLQSVRSRNTRPSGDKLKGAMFSTLGSVDGAKVLDLYAGSGALGIEALSRGATEAIFVEKDPEAVRVIQRNLDETGLSERASVARAEVSSFLRDESALAADLVLIDPPYEQGLPSGVLELLEEGGHLGSSPLIVLEASSRKLPVSLPPGFIVAGERRYGDSALVYMRRAGD